MGRMRLTCERCDGNCFLSGGAGGTALCYLKSGNQTWQWKITVYQIIDSVVRLKRTFVEGFWLPRLIVGGHITLGNQARKWRTWGCRHMEMASGAAWVSRLDLIWPNANCLEVIPLTVNIAIADIEILTTQVYSIWLEVTHSPPWKLSENKAMNAALVWGYTSRLRKLHGQCGWHQAKVVAAEDLWTLLAPLAENDPCTLWVHPDMEQFSTLAKSWNAVHDLAWESYKQVDFGVLCFPTNPLRCTSKFIPK